MVIFLYSYLLINCLKLEGFYFPSGVLIVVSTNRIICDLKNHYSVDTFMQTEYIKIHSSVGSL